MISIPLIRTFHKLSCKCPYKNIGNGINNSFMFIIQYINRSWMRLYKGRETINFYFDCLKCRQ